MGTLEASVSCSYIVEANYCPMSVELETGLPSTRLLQNYLRDKRTIEVKLVTGDTMAGTISWQDPHCLCLDVEGTPTLIWRSALASLKGI